MPVYLMRFSYTPETWSRLIENPEDRRDAARAYIEQVGGALHGFWYGFGEYDGYALFEALRHLGMVLVPTFALFRLFVLLRVVAVHVHEGALGTEADLPIGDMSDDAPMPRFALINPELAPSGRAV